MSETKTDPVGQKETESGTFDSSDVNRKLNFAYPDQVEGRGYELGLRKTYAYHCNRCNYLWFPKDFDAVNPVNNHGEGVYFVGQNIFDLEPPKACARCKSKYWREFPKRTTRSILPTKFATPDDKGFHKMDGIPRLRALHRQGKLGIVVPYCKCKHCNASRKS